MTSKQRQHLRGMANGMNAIINIGKAGVTPEIVAMAEEALLARELIKIGMLESAEISVEEAAQTVSERTRSEVVQTIGRKIILYKAPKPNQKAKIELPKAGKKKAEF